MSPKLLAPVMVLALSPVLFSAEELADLTKLREGYQKALTESAVPVRARYAEKLQALLKACTQRGDLDGALVVRKELESLKAEAGGVTEPGTASTTPKDAQGATAEFRAALVGSTWTWPTKRNDSPMVTFMADGTFKTPNWGPGKFTWQIVDKNTVRLDSDKHGSTKLTFNETTTAYQGGDFRTNEPITGTRVVPGGASAPAGGSSGGDAFGKPSP